MTQTALTAFMALVKDQECPCDHQSKKFIKTKAIRVKSVKELRSNMDSGVSTQRWVVKGTDHALGENSTSKDPCPFEAGSESSFVRVAHVIKDEQDPGYGDYPLSLAAHHVIPGKESLPESDLRVLVWKSEGEIAGDIGYDVDGAENGVWLPTHAKLSQSLGKSKAIQITDEENPAQTMSYRDLSADAPMKETASGGRKRVSGAEAPLTFIECYTYGAMSATKRQFHDSHPDYSDNIVKRLNKLKLKLDGVMAGCEECKKAAAPGGKKLPPYGLVQKLNALSAYVKSKLVGPATTWRRPMFTSQYAVGFRRDELRYKRLSGRG